MAKQADKSERKRVMTQVEAAKLLGVSRGHLNRVLNGDRESIPLLARYYNLLLERRQAAETEHENVLIDVAASAELCEALAPAADFPGAGAPESSETKATNEP